jgi:transposase
MNFLTDQERDQLKLQHKRERDKRVADRIKAVLLHDRGWSPRQIAEALFITDQAVRDHIEDYKTSQKLAPESGGSEEKLSKEQSAQNVLIQEDQTLNATSTIRFFQKIEEAYPCMQKIHVFCDNAPYYRNKAVKQYLATSKIVLHFLPPYSPNLNPIERLWKWMKERVIYNTYYEHFEDFKGAVIGFFAVLSTLAVESMLGQSLRSRVRDKFRPIEAPAANF